MSADDEDFQLRPGRIGKHSLGSMRLSAQVRRAAARAGFTRRGRVKRKGTGASGRGRIGRLKLTGLARSRRVVIKARVVRHRGARFNAAPLARHIAYLKRDGVTRDGVDAGLFDARGDRADGQAFALRCQDDRHHFRFIVSPEDANRMEDLRAFTRELMADMVCDLATPLDWVAVDHWNTDNPHIHVLVRGIAGDGTDLVIDRDYIREGMRSRAQERVTLELGLRSEQEIRAALEREVDATSWTSLDRRLERLADELTRVIDLRPGENDDREMRRLLIGRATVLGRHGLADRIGPAIWSLRSDAEVTLREMSIRTDVIKTIHRAMTAEGREPHAATLALHDADPTGPVVGRLVERGLHDELAGTGYALIDGVDGRLHHLIFEDMDLTGDAKLGAIVELRSWTDSKGRERRSLATRSYLSLEAQVTAGGATWLDRQLLSAESAMSAAGFGLEVRDAMTARLRHLEGLGLASKQGEGLVPARNLIVKLRAAELGEASRSISDRTGLAERPSAAGEYVSGTYRERVTLASGRFAMIDDGLGFQLVPWRPALEPHLGKHVTGVMSPAGIEWNLGRGKGLSL